ncbi:U2 small nuclear ribo protein auxiliary factor 50 [Chytriomyces sp. MP71]|nr:U2 small nuclear ribo protein auxiliary factor 50 [Chytriomyces sp. MP71]
MQLPVYSISVVRTGHFPLPGVAARPMHGGHGASFGTGLPLHMSGLASMSMSANPDFSGIPSLAAAATASRQSKKLYVGGVPPNATDEALLAFFNDTLTQLNIAKSAESPVATCQINKEKNYAFVEFRTEDDCTQALALDGLPFQGGILKIRRPKDYVGPAIGAGIHLPGVVGTNVGDSPHKLFVGGLPPYLNEEQVIELLKAFGDLKSFNLVKDVATGASKGFAFCEYVNPDITDIACEGLNGMELGDKKLVVQRANTSGSRPGVPAGTFLPAMIPTALLGAAGNAQPTRVLMLLNMVTAQELRDENEYEDILEDIREECGKFGEVRKVFIPRPEPGRDVPDVGKIFVEYVELEGSALALKSLAGRRFADRTVFTSYCDENLLADR